MKVKIKKWYSVASWHWQTNDENCGICRYSFEACCSNCSIPGDDCPIGIILDIFVDVLIFYFHFYSKKCSKISLYSQIFILFMIKDLYIKFSHI